MKLPFTQNMSCLGFLISAFLFYRVNGNSTTSTLSTRTSMVPTTTTTTTRPPEQCDYGHVSQIVNLLSNHLVSTIGGQENLFFSPFCLSVSLAMTYLGARGETAKEMEGALGYEHLNPEDLPQKIHEMYQNTLNSLESTVQGYTLEVANGLFIQEGFNVLPTYLDDLKNFYTAKVLSVDFRSDGETAISEINSWVSNHTAGKIEKLVNEPLDPMTLLLLANAIYFKGFWKYPFNERSTWERNFYGRNNITKKVPFMEFKKTVYFFEDDATNYSFLELDYRGDEVSMIFALPNNRSEFPTLEITSTLLCRVRKSLRPGQMHVVIPKFSLAYERELSNDLFHLGMVDLLSEERSNLSGIRNENDIFVSKVIHKAVIEVNEQGSEASAVNAISFYARSGHMRYTLFRADHPFLFCILDKRSGTILFLGRVVDL